MSQDVWIADLAPYEDSPHVVAVGWLDAYHDFPLGIVDSEVFDKLAELLKDPWQPAVAGGVHECELCVYRPDARGNDNVYVPGDGKIFIAPEMILHYMNVHRYRPPDDFCRAVLACPPMRSQEYRKALLAAGGGSLIR